ncbi:MAG: NAD(P)-dependent oxidoreductase [Chloroflexi bacterium]|nr:NAD(P)-dependent oxidoreductase [Chloroflexota bacterium]
MTTESAAPIRRVGMLGVGSMGGPIAANVARAGFEVVAYDPRPAALAEVAEQGVASAASPAEVARRTDAVLAIPYNFAQVEDATFGVDGLVDGWADRSGLLIVMSTIGPSDVKVLARRLAALGHRLVDAPVSGGHSGSVAGTLTLMVGAPEPDVERCRPVLEAFGRLIAHVGAEPGAGQSAKLVNNLLVLVHHVAMVEALTLADRSGLDLRQVYNIITASAGNSFIFEGRAPAVLDRSFVSGGALKLLVKDARLILDAAQAAGMPMFATSAAAQVFEMAQAMGLGDDDDVAVVKGYERIVGKELPIAPPSGGPAQAS